MNGTERKIEILAPLSQALELMKQILFRPFDIEKWLVIGFAAFLAHFGGGGFRVNFPTNWNRGHWRAHTWQSQTGMGWHEIPDWAWLAIIIGVPILIGIGLVLAWVGARGRFIFTDCIVRNRGAIVEPWYEYRSEGNSLFLFSLVVAIALIAITLLGIAPLVLPALLHRSIENVTFTIGLIFWIALIVVIALTWSLISQLMVPVMYRQRCRAWTAFQTVVALISEHAASFILYIIFLVAVSISLAILILLVGCLTCCIGACLFALPYIGTVILLPVEITLYGYTLLFLRQFGPEYDVWAGVTQVAAPSAATAPPVAPVIPAAPAAPALPSTPPPSSPPERSPYEPPGNSPGS